MPVARNQVATPAKGTSVASLTLVFPTNPTPGAKVIVAVFAYGPDALAPAMVADNGVSPATFVGVAHADGTGYARLWVYRADGITLPSSGSYTVTVSWSAPQDYVGAVAATYTGAAPGGPVAQQLVSGVGNTATTPSAGTGSGNLYVAVLTSGTGDNPANYATSAPFATVTQQPDGIGGESGILSDLVNGSGPQQCVWTWSDATAGYAGLLWVFPTANQLAASGASTSSGAAVISGVIPLAASGGSASSGSAHLGSETFPLAASGGSASSGAAGLTLLESKVPLAYVPPPPIGRYRYWVVQATTGERLGLLPLREVQWSRKLNDIGDLSATLPLGDPRVAAMDPLSITEPVRTLLVVERDGVIVWAGVLWRREKPKGSYDLSLSAREIGSWLDKLYLTDPRSWTQADQIEIARDLIWYASQWKAFYGGPSTGAVIPIEFEWVDGSGVLRDLAYDGSGSPSVWQALTDLVTTSDGFEFSIDTAWDDEGQAVHSFHYGYPHLGRAAATTDLLWEQGANLVDYAWDEDGEQLVTYAYCTGDVDYGNGDQQPFSESAVAYGLLDAGWLRVEQVDSLSGSGSWASQVPLMHARADAIIAAQGKPIVIPSITVRADIEPVLGSYRSGDHCRVRIDDARFPDGLDTVLRITGINVSVGDNDDEEVELQLGPAVS